MSNIIASVIAKIEIGEVVEGKIAKESTATISYNGSTELLICLNPNGNNGEIKIETEIRTPITSKHFFLTWMTQKNSEKIIDLQMIQEALEENPELADACKKLFFPQTTIEFTNTKEQPS
jgi:hypothetical protein